MLHNHAELLRALGTCAMSEQLLKATVSSRLLQVSFRTATIAPSAMLDFLRSYRWCNSSETKRPKPMELQIEFLQGEGDCSPEIDDWLLLAPQISNPVATTEINGSVFAVAERGYTEGRFETYNDPRHRAFAEYIAKGQELVGASQSLKQLRRPRRAVMLYYPVTPKGRRSAVRPPYTTAFTLLFPPNSIVSPIKFGVRRPDLASSPVVGV